MITNGLILAATLMAGRVDWDNVKTRAGDSLVYDVPARMRGETDQRDRELASARACLREAIDFIKVLQADNTKYRATLLRIAEHSNKATHIPTEPLETTRKPSLNWHRFEIILLRECLNDIADDLRDLLKQTNAVERAVSE